MDAFALVQLVLRILLAVVFIGMGAAHFVPRVRRTMGAMIPAGLAGPDRRWAPTLVTVSGVAEILGGLGLLAPWWGVRFAAGLALIALLILVFPANAQAAKEPERFGAVAVPLVPRAIGQIVLGLLILVSVI
ncbi:DoxX family membrane protein [Agrococcus sp. SCSIO52902]|uniref:DoxX family membrane protein n=1 Tax=Agrococcus sp. SCSIO52902 TaxID=2933290 RepID=UPI001FF38984|nr:DoxX family membrane protein [Agrococcus sp. SCSIO52902]UOW01077.1 DoxX family membrane protein [Agrococcus sp. SCSIO52902]